MGYTVFYRTTRKLQVHTHMRNTSNTLKYCDLSCFRRITLTSLLFWLATGIEQLERIVGLNLDVHADISIVRQSRERRYCNTLLEGQIN